MDKSSQVYGRRTGTTVDIPVWAAAVEANGRRILVDTGISDADWVSQRLGPCAVPPEMTLNRALEGIGWTPDSVDIVINSHLHYDHCDNNSLLPNADFYVSEVEWEFAYDPVVTQVSIYSNGWRRSPLNVFNYTMVDHDNFDLLPGLRIIRTPGHTPGHQSVLVNTDDGVVCIAGDAANNMDNFIEDLPNAIFTNPAQSVASLAKIRRFSDRVLLGHDPEVEAGQTSSFPRVQSALSKLAS